MTAKIYPSCFAFVMLVLLLARGTVLAQTQPSQPPSAKAANPTAKNNEDAAELVKQGEKLNSEGKPDEAMALYQRALDLSPDLYQAQLFMGVALDLQGKYQEARQHLGKAIQLASEQETVQALRVMAVSYAFEHNLEEVSRYEQRAFDLQYKWQQYSEAAATANELARIYLEFGDINNAFQWYQTGRLTAFRKPGITQAEKDLASFRYESALARIAARRGQSAQAQQALGAAKAILDKADNPDQMRFYPYLAGYVALYTGDFTKAIQELQKADLKDPFVLSLLAQAYEKSGDRKQAMDCYKKILTINTHNPSNAFARPLARQKLAAQAPAGAAPQPS